MTVMIWEASQSRAHFVLAAARRGLPGDPGALALHAGILQKQVPAQGE